MNPHADYNGSSLVLIVAVMLAALVTWKWTRDKLYEARLRCRDVLRAGTPRIMTGACVIFVGVALGRIAWWPVRPMLIAQNQEWTIWYATVAAWPANLFNIFTVVGLVIIMWPALKRRLGKWSLAVTVAVAVAVYLIGALSTLWLAEMLR